MTTQSSARFCPKCGSPSLVINTLANEVSCDGCQWVGKPEELVVAPFEHDLGSDAQVLEIFVREFRNAFAKVAAKDIGLLLKKWGFIPEGNPLVQVQLLSRFFETMSRAMVQAVLEERKKIEKELSNAN